MLREHLINSVNLRPDETRSEGRDWSIVESRQTTRNWKLKTGNLKLQT
jgi:hypothetical protein